MAKPDPDIHKLDYYLTREGAMIPVGVQLKATGQDVVRGDHLAFEIDRKTYNVLREKGELWRFLIVLPLPLVGDWVTMGNDCVQIHRSMYWHDLMGQPALPPKAKSLTCHIPLHQRVTPAWLAGVFREYVEGRR